MTLDTSRLNAAIIDLQTKLGLDGAEAVRLGARSFLTRAMRFTPPKTKRQGENAVGADLFSGRVIGVTGKKARGIFMLYDRGQPRGDKVYLFTDKHGQTYGVDRNLYRPSATMQEMEAHHLKYRGKNGRTTTAGSYSRDIGRWRFVDRMVVNKQSLQQYMKLVKARVGLMKAAWTPAAAAVGLPVRAWVARHGTVRRHVLVNDLTNTKFPSITMGNTSRGISHFSRAARFALTVSAKAIPIYVRRQLALRAKQNGF